MFNYRPFYHTDFLVSYITHLDQLGTLQECKDRKINVLEVVFMCSRDLPLRTHILRPFLDEYSYKPSVAFHVAASILQLACENREDSLIRSNCNSQPLHAAVSSSTLDVPEISRERISNCISNVCHLSSRI